MANMAKYGHFEYLVEYPIWVSIKTTLTGKLAVDGQNLIYCDWFEENIKNLNPRNVQILIVFE